MVSKEKVHASGVKHVTGTVIHGENPSVSAMLRMEHFRQTDKYRDNMGRFKQTDKKMSA